uniref:mis18-binding protein 1 isoform X2 n=1 Tax=Semicossyphus pulcher TaxID=241346 RepID=UPI0037E7C015
MASYHHIFQQSKPRFESPAKVFAKLKSKVQREEMCANEGFFSNTANNSLCGEKHGAVFKSPRKRAESTWMTDELKENQRFGPYRNEAQALTLSPIPSPEKRFGYSYSDITSKPVEEMSHVTDVGHGYTPRKRAFLESTAVSHPLSLYNRAQIHTEPPQSRHLDGFQVSTSRTPVKMQPREEDCVRRSEFEEESAFLDTLKSPALMFSPMRNRLRKRKSELQEFNRVSYCTNQASNEVFVQPLERKTSSAFSEDDAHSNTCMDDLEDDEGFFTHEAMLCPRPTAVKRCKLIAVNNPPMSPAKIFAYMKERESKTEQQGISEVCSSTRHLFDEGNSHLSRGTPPFIAHNMDENPAYRNVPENIVPVNQSPVESADSQSDTEDVLIPAAPPQPVLLEDPLVLNTPRISIPKKQNPVFKRNKWPQTAKFPSESVIYLKKWLLRKNHKGLFVDGIHRDDNIPWNSNIIVERVSKSVVKTVSGSVYILVGKMNFDVNSGLPNWLLKKFVNGFPANWKALYEKFLSEKDKETTGNTEGRGAKANTKSEASSINVSQKRHRQKPLKTPASCPPAPSSSTQVSRSGRVIKPPLEYWKGGRVILDAHMNVTIHECYETSICFPEVTTTVSARASKKSARVFLPCAEGQGRSESTSDQEAPAPLRRVKAQVRKSNRAKVSAEERPSYSPETPVETLSSPDEGSARATRSSRRRPPERKLYVETVPKKQSEPEKSKTKKSKKQTTETRTPSVRISRRKQAVSSSPESPSVNDKTQSSDEEVFRRPKREKEVQKKRRGKVLNKSRQSNRFLSSPSSESSEESPKEPKKRTRVTKNNAAAQTQVKHKQSKCTKTSPPTKPAPKPAQSSKKQKANKSNTLKQQEEDEDEWTAAELMKLREAVSYYPKHIAGYWGKVARTVGTRSAEECHSQHTSEGTSQTPAKKPSKSRKQKVEAPKDPVTDQPVISARVGTLRRKQQVREFLENMPREDVDDVFSSAFMQNKRFEIPSMCPSEDQDFRMTHLEPLTPGSTGFPEVKTPQCLHITPDMMGSPNRSNDDKYVFQLQKRMRKNQFNVCKQAPSSKSFRPTPSVKQTMRRRVNTENDSFVVWEMFPGKDVALSDSGEEEDFYFSDND